MGDVFSPEKRSEVMSLIRGRGNRSTEQRMIVLMRAARITGWRRSYRLVGKPDFVFLRSKLAVFIDGDFWHCNPRNYQAPKTNAEFWADKIKKNKARDKWVNCELKRKGWNVLRVWESSMAKHPERVISRLIKALENEN